MSQIENDEERMTISRIRSSTANSRAKHGRTAFLAVAWIVALCQTAAAYTPNIVRWHIEATVTKIVDPLGLFPEMRLGDPLHGMLRYDLSLYANPLYSGTYDLNYTNATWADVTQVTIENPRDGSKMRFQTNVDGDFADVDVFNNYPDAEHGDFDLFYASQSVVPPAGYQGTDAVWAVWLQGPTTNFSLPVVPWINNHPPATLNLDDWPIATMDFWDGYFEDPTATNIEADIYALSPILPPYLPGDFDFDRDVDADDYSRWRTLYGNDIGLDANADADGNGDGVVDAADYVVWRKNLGQPTGSGSIADRRVPEPPTTVILIVAAVGMGLQRRRIA